MLLFDYFDDNTQELDDNFDIDTIAYIGDECFDSSKGYYDGDRIDKKYMYFPTKIDLYTQEVFEPIIDYCNKMLVPENSLYLGDFEGGAIGFTTGFIASSDETENRRFHKLFTQVNRTRKAKCIKYDLFDSNKHPKIRNF